MIFMRDHEVEELFNKVASVESLANEVKSLKKLVEEKSQATNERFNILIDKEQGSDSRILEAIGSLAIMLADKLKCKCEEKKKKEDPSAVKDLETAGELLLLALSQAQIPINSKKTAIVAKRVDEFRQALNKAYQSK